MSDNPYPNLGFNPVPGAPADVAGLRGQINTSADAVRETNDLLTRLRNSNDNVWKGDAGDAFRAGFDATLGQDLGYAQKSLERAVSVLDQWHTDLVGYQDTAKGLEAEAADAKGQHTKAVATLHTAKSNPDLALANVMFTDQGELQAAQSRLDAATAQVRSASTAVDNWQGKIDSILQRARDLETQHDHTARRAATELDAAAKDFAPSPPDRSIWDRIADAVKGVGEWIDEHRKGLHEFLANTAAITGLLAIITPPPVDAIMLAVSLAAGAGALGLDLTDSEMRDDLLHGSLTEKLHAAETLATDTLGVIPGVAALSKVGKVAALGDGIGDIGRFESMARTWAESAHSPGFLNERLVRNEGITNLLDKSGLTNGTHRLLQHMNVVGEHNHVPDPGVALKVFNSAKKSITGLSTWGLEQVTD
ncbi:hypothetical protein ACFYO1_38260 [Nocardia sp. NPDC006044]|uniref:hypothetical protein n=1 Tax=Nocardia sp. NPDC006044 TaxID=3364306 RepID=UPI0036AC4807